MRLISMTVRGALVAAVLAIASAGSAQGFFYQQLVRDGRIYVFNQMKEYDNFRKTGEMGKSITRVGMGPNGETMIFDSEEAIHLYNFKNDRDGEVIEKKEEKKPTMKVSWKDGKTTIETDNASLSISNRLQTRFTLVSPDGGDSLGSFRIRRMKTKFEGWAFWKPLTYEVQLNWPDTANPLEDANLDWDFTNGQKQFRLKAGQFKVPFGRQELTSSGSQQFVDRSNVSGEFAKGRDAGVQIWGQTKDAKLEWRAGMFNGNGRTKSANDNSKYQYNFRLMWQPNGDVKYSESDLESKDKPLIALAANFEKNDARGATKDVVDFDRTVWGFDGVLKYKGFSAMAEYFTRDSTPDADKDGKIGGEVGANGFHAQIGMFLIRDHLEIAGRYARLDLSDLKENDSRKEWGIGVNYFFSKHPLKLQADWRTLEDEAKKTKDHEVRIQSQIIF